MTEAQTILKMIENVDPADTQTLDEIDARVWFFNNDATFVSANAFKGCVFGYTGRHNFPEPEYSETFEIGGQSGFTAPQYTRSRDALKSIRPDGWCFSVIATNPTFRHCISTQIKKDGSFEDCCQSPRLLTEELAELHAIIKVIEWERSQ